MYLLKTANIQGCPSVAFVHFLRIDFEKMLNAFLRSERQFSKNIASILRMCRLISIYFIL